MGRCGFHPRALQCWWVLGGCEDRLGQVDDQGGDSARTSDAKENGVRVA